MQYLRHTLTKKLSVVYLTFKFKVGVLNFVWQNSSQRLVQADIILCIYLLPYFTVDLILREHGCISSIGMP